MLIFVALLSCFVLEVVLNEKQKYPTVGTVLKFNREIEQKEAKIDIPKTQIHDRSLSWHGTGTSINSGRVKLVLSAQ